MNKNNNCKASNYDWGRLILELFVVFLGITAGFVLNNWREGKSSKELESKYIESFMTDVESNIEELENAWTSDSIWLKKAKPILGQMAVEELNVDSAKRLISMVVQVSKIEIHTTTYTDMVNSGNMKIIRSFNLKKEIVDYHIALEGLAFVEKYVEKHFSSFVLPFVFNKFDILKGEFIDNNILHTPEFSNIIAGYTSMIQQREDNYSKLLKESKQFKLSLEDIIKRDGQ